MDSSDMSSWVKRENSRARIYLRVSTQRQSLERQERIVEAAKASGYYIAGVYREKASAAGTDRPELQRLLTDLQAGDVVIAERMDRLSRLPLREAEALVQEIETKGARLSIPGVVDLQELVEQSSGVSRVIVEAVQSMLLKLTLQMARDDWEERRRRQAEGIERAKRAGKFTGRAADQASHDKIIELRSANFSITKTAELCGCSQSTVKRVWAKAKRSSSKRAR